MIVPTVITAIGDPSASQLEVLSAAALEVLQSAAALAVLQSASALEVLSACSESVICCSSGSVLS